MDEETIKKSAKQRKYKRTMRRCFFMGFISCIIVLLMLTVVLDCGAILLGEKYESYQGMKKSFGKYYEMTTLLDDYALNDYKAKKIDDDVYRDLIKSMDDPYAAYYTKKEYEEFEKRFNDYYVGVGLVVTKEDDNVIVDEVIEDSPAEKAGIKAKDIIYQVDGKTMKDVEKASKAMRGDAGTQVEITIIRNNKTKTYTITRAKIDQKSLAYEVLDKKNGIGYIYLAGFNENSDKEFELAVKDLKNQGCKKIVFDLRNNGGGLTEVAYNICDYLLPACNICTEVDKQGNEDVHKSKSSNAGVELVLLVNGYTASASEIVSAAIQDNNAGVIVGTKTYGKGVIQATHVFEDGSAVKFTIKEYFRPNGKSVNKKGITPDYIIEENDKMLDKALELLKKK